jgi:hypothetical protein
MIQLTTGTAVSAAAPFVVGRDGYLRCELSAVRNCDWQHVLSGLDDEQPVVGLATGAFQAEISGFTEWTSGSAPALSIGWDWRCAYRLPGAPYVRQGCARSNIMFIDDRGDDLGFDRTAELIGGWIDSWNWVEPVLAGACKNRA